MNTTRRGFLASVAALLGLGWRAELANEKPKRSIGHIVGGQVRANGPCPCCGEVVFQVTGFIRIKYDKVNGVVWAVKQDGPPRLICEPCGCDISDIDVKCASEGTLCT